MSEASAELIRRALEELGIDRPYYTARVRGNVLEVALYGGEVVTFPIPAAKGKRGEQDGRRGRRKAGQVQRGGKADE